MVKASYSMTWSMSAARLPDSSAAVRVKSGIMVMLRCQCACAAPIRWTGLCGKSFARSALVMITAPPPSVTRQQSSSPIGSQIMRALTTSSTVRSSRIVASGFIFAHWRAATATSASCSRVVPYSCMCRAVAKA